MRAEDILFSLPFPAVVVDGKGRILTVNQKFESLLNRSEKYLKGTEIFRLFNNKESIRKKIKEAFSNLVEIYGFKDGDYLLNFSPFYVSSRVEGVFILIQPAKDSPFERDMLTFLKGLSHEIRNPLSGIKGAVRLFGEIKAYDEELVRVIVEETERIERLLNDVIGSFDFSSLKFVPTNIHMVIQDVVKLFSSEVKRKGIKVVYDFDPSLPEIPLNIDRAKQAFMNVFKNAIEAIEGEGKIRIETGYAIHPSGFIYVKVSDTGRGMDEEELRKLFLPFYTTKERGLGLGTFITAEIVKAHGGEIKVSSKRGEGTSVTIMLPMKRRNGKDTCS